MPPSVDQLSSAIEQALLASTRPEFREKDEGGNATSNLPENMKVIVRCIAQGIYDALVNWQSTALVNGGICTPNGPIAGGRIEDSPLP